MTHENWRGSRNHILELVSSEGYIETMNAMLAGAQVRLSERDSRQPRNLADATEWTLRKFLRTHGAELGFDFTAFDRWWVADQYRNPQWDLLSTCEIGGRRGLLLVEGKANESEVDEGGKELDANASLRSGENHEQIGRCVEEARAGLASHFAGIGISRDTHYQLSNRVASAWKLAQCGLPVVLLYLGFTSDTYFADHLRSADHWQRVMGGYMKNVLPHSFAERIVDGTGGASMRLIIRALPVLNVSV